MEPATTVTALLAEARDLLGRQTFDAEAMLDVLGAIPLSERDMQTYKTVVHARRVAAAALNKSTAYSTVARYALHQVVVSLEQQSIGTPPN